MDKYIEYLEALGRQELVVSIVYGRLGEGEHMYSVDVLNQRGECFKFPFAAHSFREAVLIAWKEVIERSWVSVSTIPSGLLEEIDQYFESNAGTIAG